MSNNENQQSPRVFISYTWDSEEHKDKVLGLAQALRNNGIDCWIDQFDHNPDNLQRWMISQIEQAQFVLLVCSESYIKQYIDPDLDEDRGFGATFETTIILDAIYKQKGKNSKFYSIYFKSSQKNERLPGIQTVCFDLSRYDLRNLKDDDSRIKGNGAYAKLFSLITNRPEIIPSRLAPMPCLEPQQSAKPRSKSKNNNVPQCFKPNITNREDLLEFIKKDQAASEILSTLFDILRHPDHKIGIANFEPIAHSSLISNKTLRSDFCKNNFKPARTSINRYKIPPKIISWDIGRPYIGSRSHREYGEERVYSIARNDIPGALPGQVRIFYRENSTTAKISDINL